jgi:hypothetical protein
VPEYVDPPAEITEGLRKACLGLPEAYEEPAWVGTRWRIRKRTFAHVIGVDDGRRELAVMTFRSSGAELDVLRRAGHPFFRPGWGTNVVGMALDPDVDWAEVAELLTESYCVLAPKKLVALVDRPAPDGPED